MTRDGASLSFVRFTRDRRPPRAGRCAQALNYQALGGKTREMNIRPLQDRVIVRRIKEEEKTAGGIIIPDTAKEKPQEGKVVAVGKGRIAEGGTLVKPDLRKGDSVLFGKYAGNEINIDGVEHIIMREDDILGVVES